MRCVSINVVAIVVHVQVYDCHSVSRAVQDEPVAEVEERFGIIRAEIEDEAPLAVVANAAGAIGNSCQAYTSTVKMWISQGMAQLPFK